MLQGRTVAHQSASRVLPRSFYARPTLAVLPDLIGCLLVHVERAGRTSGLIVEAEAYIGESDAACHAAPGPTRRNAPLYGPPGIAYVYLNYGLHEMVNAVTEPAGSPAAILIRALAPVEGIARMRWRRLRLRRQTGLVGGPIATADLCRGPGNLTVALGIDRRLNGADLTSGALRIEARGDEPIPLAWSTRIGIRVATDRLWRCTWDGHVSVSAARGRRLSGRATASARPSARRGS
jgi:DNA-3-methyladenine glycosylase